MFYNKPKFQSVKFMLRPRDQYEFYAFQPKRFGGSLKYMHFLLLLEKKVAFAIFPEKNYLHAFGKTNSIGIQN